MIVHNEYAQGSLEWMSARAGIPTASEFDNLVTPEFKIRIGQMPKSYLAKKIAEAWIQGPLPQLNAFPMEQGSILEGEAIPFYELETGEKVNRVGFVTTNDGRLGCSPDGLIGEDSGIECKAPLIQTHCGYLLDGGVPKDYGPQVHGSMLVTGLPRWKFFSYCRNMPPLIVTVERDENKISILRQALQSFLEAFDKAWSKLIEINGGPPPPPRKFTPTPGPVQFSWEQSEDIIP